MSKSVYSKSSYELDKRRRRHKSSVSPSAAGISHQKNTFNEAYSTINNLSFNKAPGYDLITTKVIKELLHSTLVRHSAYCGIYRYSTATVCTEPLKSG